jgi:hypothetical protein
VLFAALLSLVTAMFLLELSGPVEKANVPAAIR